MNDTTQTVETLGPATRLLLSSLLGLTLISLCWLPLASTAQETPPGSAEQYQATQPAEPEKLSAPQLEQLLAPIALYPDALLSQVLMACTYPLEVIEAYRWASDPNNAALKGSALEAALQVRDWDPSVKSLVPFPDILKTMNDKLGWMQQLGNAFLAQEADVMDAVQRLRAQAAAAGNLQSNEQQKVVTQAQTIVIEPASPSVVYVPVYDPLVVYGTWLWPAYPPIYFAPFHRYAIRTGFFTWFSFGTVGLFWGWSNLNWHSHYIHIDRHRYNQIIAYSGRPSYLRNTWRHDPYHRRGVPYRDPVLRSRYRPNPPGAPASRRNYRGYQPTVRMAPPRSGTAATTRVPARPARPAQPAKPVQPRPSGTASRPALPPPTTRPTQPAQPRTGISVQQRTQQEIRARRTQPRTGTSPLQPTPPVTRTSPMQPTPRVTRTSPLQPQPAARPARRAPPAFENYTSGAAARAAAERARVSRQSKPAPAARAPAKRPNQSQGGRPNRRPH